MNNLNENNNMKVNKENSDQTLNAESLIIDNAVQDEKNIEKTDKNSMSLIFNSPLPCNYQDLNLDEDMPSYHGNDHNNNNNNNNDNIMNNDYMNIERCDSCSSKCSCHSNNSSQIESHDCNSSCNSKTPINPKENNDTECDIIHSNFCSMETVIDKGSSSNPLNINEKDEVQSNSNRSDDNIILINETFSLNDDLNTSSSNLQNDNMTMISNGSNNFNDLTREELEPTSTAWNSWKIWCTIKILFSLLIIMFGIRALIVDKNRICNNNFKYFSLAYVVIAILQILLNIALIFYLPHKIYQINYAMHRRLCISKILWGIQGFIDIFQLIMIPIGIKVLKGSSNICFDKSRAYDSSTYNYIYYITLLSSCIYILIVALLLVLPCWTLFMLLPRYEGVSMTKFRKISTVEVTRDLLEQESFCVICMEQFKLKSKVKQLPCKHIYHKKCISIWFAEHNKCPTCRYEI